MQTTSIFFIVYHFAALASLEEDIFQKEVHAEIGSAVILSCEISNNTLTQSWRKGFIVLTQGFEINDNEKLDIIIDERFYNLKIYNITENDFDTYWCETQQGNSITAKGTRLIHSVTSTVNLYEDTTTDRHYIRFQSTLSDSETSTGIYVGQSFYNGLFAAGFVVVCLFVGCKFYANKYKGTIARRTERSPAGNENQDELQVNGTNYNTSNETAPEENEYIFPQYETIDENGMIEMSHPTTSQNLSNLPSASNIIQSLQPDNTYLDVIEEDNTYLDVIEDTNNQKLDPRTKLMGDEDHVSITSSSPREERNMSTFIFLTKNGEVDKGNTIIKESPVTIETHNFEDSKTSNDFTSVSSSSSEQSTCERILERDQKACEHQSQYMSLNVNDMEYLNSYSSPITENKLRESDSQNSNNSESSGTNIL